jgi:hypothetical protein
MFSPCGVVSYLITSMPVCVCVPVPVSAPMFASPELPWNGGYIQEYDHRTVQSMVEQGMGLVHQGGGGVLRQPTWPFFMSSWKTKTGPKTMLCKNTMAEYTHYVHTAKSVCKVMVVYSHMLILYPPNP